MAGRAAKRMPAPGRGADAVAIPTAVPSPWLARAPWLVLAAGVLLRLLFCLGNDYRNTYDDHFHVIAMILEKHRLPDPAEGWQCYQPPLYHLLGAGVYAPVRGVAAAAGLPADRAHWLGRKAVQLTSVVYGALALWGCLAIMRLVFPDQPGVQAAGLAFVALLPGHIYMSGMATNDALVYATACWTTWGLLQWHRHQWALRWALFAGGMGGLSCLAKQYGLVMILVGGAAVVGSLLLRWREVSGPVRQLALRSVVVMALSAGLVGSWPYLRSYFLYGNPLLSNTHLWPDAHGPGRPPGSVRAVSWFSFRPLALLAKPWVHARHVASFWTEMYARMWFDYEDTLTRWHYGPWQQYYSHIWSDRRLSLAQKWDRQLNWPDTVVDPVQANQARALCVLGALPTVIVLAGLWWSLGRAGSVFDELLLSLLFWMSLLPVVYQTLRFPNYACMKFAFALTMLPAMAVFFARSCQQIRQRGWRWLAWVVAANVALLAVVVVWHILTVAFFPAQYVELSEPL